MVKNIKVAELQKYVEQKAVFLDVREAYELPKFDLPNHINIPMDEILERISEIPKERNVLVYCHMGMRSSVVVSALFEKYGFDNLINIDGGSVAMSSVLPSID